MTPYYEQRLASCGHNEKLTYRQQGENIENNKNIGRNEKRNITWFNPLYSKSLKTNIGKYLFILLNKYFSPAHKLYKIFNKNTLKLSYSRMPNLEAKIKLKENARKYTAPINKIMQLFEKKKIAQWDEPASLKMFYTTLE